MENKRKFRPAHDLKLMDQVRQVLHYHHYAYQTEKTYCSWIEQYIRFHKCNKHPREMGKKEIESFLSHLATERKVSASTPPTAGRTRPIPIFKTPVNKLVTRKLSEASKAVRSTFSFSPNLPYI